MEKNSIWAFFSVSCHSTKHMFCLGDGNMIWVMYFLFWLRTRIALILFNQQPFNDVKTVRICLLEPCVCTALIREQGSCFWLQLGLCSYYHWRKIPLVLVMCPSCQADAQTPSSLSHGPQRMEKLWTCSSFWPIIHSGCLPPVHWIVWRSTDGYNDLFCTDILSIFFKVTNQNFKCLPPFVKTQHLL